MYVSILCASPRTAGVEYYVVHCTLYTVELTIRFLSGSTQSFSSNSPRSNRFISAGMMAQNSLFTILGTSWVDVVSGWLLFLFLDKTNIWDQDTWWIKNIECVWILSFWLAVFRLWTRERRIEEYFDRYLDRLVYKANALKYSLLRRLDEQERHVTLTFDYTWPCRIEIRGK